MLRGDRLVSAKSICTAVIATLAAFAAIIDVKAQDRDLPEEVRALAVVCSSGASSKFRGEIEGGINRLFGKILEGQGELEFSKSEQDFLESFEDENLRLEARKIYNDCALGALQIVYNLKKEKAFQSSDSRLLVPDSLTVVQQGQRFALRSDDVINLQNGGYFNIKNSRDPEEKKKCVNPYAVAYNEGSTNSDSRMNILEYLAIPNKRNCRVVLYGARAFGGENVCVYSFSYECS